MIKLTTTIDKVGVLGSMGGYTSSDPGDPEYTKYLRLQKAEDGGVIITAQNKSNTIQVRTPDIQVLEWPKSTDSLLLNGPWLSSALGTLRGEPSTVVELQCEAAGKDLKVHAEIQDFTIPTVTLDTFPSLSVMEPDVAVDVAWSDFTSLMDAASKAVEPTSDQPLLRGIHLSVIDNELVAVATTRPAFAHVRIKVQSGELEDETAFNCLVGPSSIPGISDLIGFTKAVAGGDVSVGLSEDRRKMVIVVTDPEGEDAIVSNVTCMANFDKYPRDRILETIEASLKNSSELELSTRELVGALKSAAVIAGFDQQFNEGASRLIGVVLAPDQLSLKVQGQATYHDEMDAVWKGKEGTEFRLPWGLFSQMFTTHPTERLRSSVFFKEGLQGPIPSGIHLSVDPDSVVEIDTGNEIDPDKRSSGVFTTYEMLFTVKAPI